MRIRPIVTVAAGITALALLVATAPLAWTRGRREAEVMTLTDRVVAGLAAGQTITVRGALASYGSQPHTFIGLETENPDAPDGARIVALVGESAEDVRRLLGATIVVTGTVVQRAVEPGIPLAMEITSYEVEVMP